MIRWPEAGVGAGGRHGFPWRAAGLVLVVLLTLAGSGLLIMAMPGQADPPPQPDPAAAPVIAEPAPVESPDDPTVIPPPTAEPPAQLPAAVPTALRISRIDLAAELIKVGIGEHGRVEVPPLEQAHLAGWYERGPSPGELGNAVVVGHVDSYATGPAVFFSLGAVRPGDLVEVDRADGSQARFVVEGVASYPKPEFPTEMVFGDSSRANLRLVTCGGEFDPNTGEYPDNVVVFATLVDT